jgi:hypothetical protein
LAAGDTTPFSFAAYGDSAFASGGMTFRQVQSRINQVDPDFAVLLGDNIYNVGSHTEADGRFDPLVNPEGAAWQAGHIDYIGYGNHDVGTSQGLPSEQLYNVPVQVAGQNAYATPPNFERPEHAYSFDYGNVHFITFDSNTVEPMNQALIDQQITWMIADLQASTAQWKIVYAHHPIPDYRRPGEAGAPPALVLSVDGHPPQRGGCRCRPADVRALALLRLDVSAGRQ